MTAKTINRRLDPAAKAAGLGEDFSGHSGPADDPGQSSPDSAIMWQGGWSSSVRVAQYTRGESARWLK